MNRSTTEETLFDGALRLAPAERAAYLAEMCAGDAMLRQRIEALLHGYGQAGGFLEASAAPTLRLTPSPSIPLAEKAGDKIGPYKLLQQIGEGGCGVVYMAEQEEPVRRRVALKVIKLGMDTKSVIARFEAERQALALMDHPNIAKVLEAGATETGRPYFVMELVRGIKITEYCDQNNFTTQQRLDLFMQVCRAIQHAHQKGIIHRDIKPSNILVTVNDGVPVPKVIDFGIAKATSGQQLTDKTLFTAFEQFIGTPAYMSPEQAMMTSLDIDTRSDIYSLGVLLYELLTGRTPFDGGELLRAGLDEMRRTIREKEPVRPSTRLTTLPDDELSTTAQRRGLDSPKLVSELRGDLDWIVMKCLEKDRPRRYETANGLAMDLQRYLNNEPVSAAAPSAWYLLGKYSRRHRAGLAVAAAIVFVLLAGTVASTWQAVRATRAEKRAGNERIKAEDERAVSDAVREFLQRDLLAQASPEVAPEPDLKLRTVLDRASEKIEGRFTNQPLVEAGVRMTIADTYHDLGNYTAMMHHGKRAFDLYRDRLGETNAMTIGAMSSLGDAYRHMGQTTNAIVLLRQMLDLRQQALGLDDPKTLTGMNNLALAYRDGGRLPEALQLGEKTLKLMKTKLGPDHPDTLACANGLATIYGAAGRSAEELSLYEETLKLIRAKLGPDRPLTLAVINNLAVAYANADRLAEALPLFEETSKIMKAKFGPDHPSTLSIINNVALLYQEQGNLEQSEPLFREVITIGRKRAAAGISSEIPQLGVALHHLADVLKGRKMLPEAHGLAEEAATLYQRHPGWPQEEARHAFEVFAFVQEAEGDWAGAEKSWRGALAIRAQLRPDDWPLFVTRSQVGAALLAQKKLTEAEPFLLSGYEGMSLRETQIPASNRDSLRSALSRLVQLYTAWDKAAQAAGWKQKLDEFDKAEAGKKPPTSPP